MFGYVLDCAGVHVYMNFLSLWVCFGLCWFEYGGVKGGWFYCVGLSGFFGLYRFILVKWVCMYVLGLPGFTLGCFSVH